MAVQLTLTDLSSGYQGSDIQANFTAIEDEFDKVLYRNGDLTVTGTIDMNSQRLVNLPAPTSSTEPLRKDDQFTSAEAQSFASDAETAKDDAETALFNFQDHWLGPSATEPTQDGNGNALEEGDLYFDTGNNVFMAYDGTDWVNPELLFFPFVNDTVTANEDELNILTFTDVTSDEFELLHEFYEEETIVLDGDFTSGTVHVSRIKNLITISSPLSASHPADATPSTSSAFLPSQFRPPNVYTVVSHMDSSGLQMVSINSGGSITVTHKDWTGSNITPTSANEFTISFRLQ